MDFNAHGKEKPVKSTPDVYDVLVIGGGMVGSMILRELSRFKLRVIMVEKEPQPGFGATKATMAYIHRNHMNPPGSLRARLCMNSQSTFLSLSKELGVGYREADEINIAFDSNEEAQVRLRLDWAFKNGEKNFRTISREEVARLEPHVSRDFIYAIHSVGHGMIHPAEWAFALVENAISNGARALMETEVTGLRQEEDGFWTVDTDKGSLQARFVINAAGLYADHIAHLAGDVNVRQFPARGTFAIFDTSVSSMLRNLVYVAGIDTTFSQAIGPTLHGNVILGLGHFREPKDLSDTRVTREELDDILKIGKKIVPNLPERDLITSFAGIKVTNNLAEHNDFFLGLSSVSPTLIHALICPPGITASPGIARAILDLLSNSGLDLKEKPDFKSGSECRFKFHDSNDEDRGEAIKKDPAYGHIICRCEQISEAEIRDAVRRGAKTLDGVKQLTRAGMGRCQGGFCSLWVLKIISDELDIPLEKVTRKGKGSEEVVPWDFKGKQV
ncbi:putative Glycerol-3-phosphate dehydrogenase [uncultured Spirochaetota bacterium]|jgi:glycerol-3-phosphate dehydrogenase|uniref:Putative Glycerol-3-phosphate dehydrogenase n=1 Tax=uncultured Spirochaetota bacterium TaxID=460511 RepID=A0A652ZS75_9SPIR|nr:putative Glycerol-3-phosphate dehydrogenase [uncultured Spirochaetota bacterium]